MPHQVWIVHFGGWQYKVKETTTATLQRGLFGQNAIVYTDKDEAIAACHQRNKDFERRKQRHLEAAA